MNTLRMTLRYYDTNFTSVSVKTTDLHISASISHLKLVELKIKEFKIVFCECFLKVSLQFVCWLFANTVGWLQHFQKHVRWLAHEFGMPLNYQTHPIRVLVSLILAEFAYLLQPSWICLSQLKIFIQLIIS